MKKIILFFLTIFLPFFVIAQKADKNEVVCVKISNKIVPNQQNKIYFINYSKFENNDYARSLFSGKNNLMNIILNAIYNGKLYIFELNYGNFGIPENVLSLQEIRDITKNKGIAAFIFQEKTYYLKNNTKQKQITGIIPILKDTTNNHVRYQSAFVVKYPEIKDILEKEKNGTDKTFDEIIENNLCNAQNMSKRDIYTNGNEEMVKTYSDIFQNPQTLTKQELDNLNAIPPEPAEPFKYPQINNDSVFYAKYVYERVWKYGYRDTNWFSTKNWEADKKNAPLFLPENPQFGYRNLISLIMYGIHNAGLSAYKTYSYDIGEEYKEIITEEEILKRFDFQKEEIIENYDGGYDTIITTNDNFLSEITSYIFHKLNLYNKNGELLQSKLLGICPIRRFYRPYDIEKNKPLYSKVFWIYYPEFQKIAAQTFVYPQNCNLPLTFDQFLNQNYYFGIDMGDSTFLNNIEYTFDYKNLYVNLENPYYCSGNILNKNITDNIIFTEKPKQYISIPKKYKKAEVGFIIIDKKDNQNFPLFSPRRPSLGFVSLADIITYQIIKHNFNSYRTDQLDTKLSEDEVLALLGQTTDTVVENSDGDINRYIEKTPYTTFDITKYLLKVIRFYDKDKKIIDNQILAICPIKEYYREYDIDKTNPFYKKTFWIRYSDFVDVFNKQNLTKPNYSDVYYNYAPDSLYTLLNDSRFFPRADMSIFEFLENGKYKASDYSFEKISKRKVKEILKKYGIQ